MSDADLRSAPSMVEPGFRRVELHQPVLPAEVVEEVARAMCERAEKCAAATVDELWRRSVVVMRRLEDDHIKEHMQLQEQVDQCLQRMAATRQENAALQRQLGAVLETIWALSASASFPPSDQAQLKRKPLSEMAFRSSLEASSRIGAPSIPPGWPTIPWPKSPWLAQPIPLTPSWVAAAAPCTTEPPQRLYMPVPKAPSPQSELLAGSGIRPPPGLTRSPSPRRQPAAQPSSPPSPLLTSPPCKTFSEASTPSTVSPKPGSSRASTPPGTPPDAGASSFAFAVTLRRLDAMDLGLEVRASGKSDCMVAAGGCACCAACTEQYLVVEGVFVGGVVEAWNRQCDDRRVIQKGDFIVSINGMGGEAKMREECGRSCLLKVAVERRTS